ncbi:MAG: hypothetical protein JWQ35_1770 [Bacteriovoracaceae bacterium]|nr:hypothetical protein [Bacteriovoracaceae bacterium]
MKIASAVDFLHNLRRYDRFCLTDIKGLKGRMNELGRKHSLISLSRGGCGFFSRTQNEVVATTANPIVNCEFKWSRFHSKPVNILGRLVYCVPKESNGKKVFYFGIEFLQPELILPLILKLEDLAARGKVSTFVR